MVLEMTTARMMTTTNSSVTQRPDGRGKTALVKLDRPLLIADTKITRKFAEPKMGLIERQYAKALESVTHRISDIVTSYYSHNAHAMPTMLDILRTYAEALVPWARRTGTRMLQDVNARNHKQWLGLNQVISQQLKHDLRRTSVGMTMHELLEDQVELIKSLPLEAAERVQKLVLSGMENSERADKIAEMILDTGYVAKSRAIVIARTEVARTASALTQARATAAGITHYRWQTAGDADVRPGHKAMQGKICEFANPPAVNENGRIMYHHPGEIWNCFTVDTLVTPGEFRSVIRARYSGELVAIYAAGSKFEATPNHPVLTPRGWVTAGSLQVGDEVCAMPEDSAHSVMYDVQHRQVTFGEVFEAAALCGERTACVVLDLYGDPVEEQIDVVSVDQHLVANGRANFRNHFRDQVIARADCRILGRGILRRCAEVFESLSSCFRHLILSAFDPGPGHLQFVGDAPVSHDATAYYNGSDGVSIDAQLSGNGRYPKTALIEPENFRHVFVTNRSTRVVESVHVFTLETEIGYYGVGSTPIVTRNCRCWPEPIVELED